MMFSTRNESPFTATQWEELEHQALIFKYMMSRIPIPPDLLLSLKKNISPVLPNFFAPQHYRWGCFQMGYGRTQDPEPGRCRRTDGKKWRCSKDAFPDSKYCERHMHRGRNRSRKLVEMTNNSKSIPSPFSSCFKPSGFDYSGQNDTTQLKLDTGSYSSTDKDCRYPCGEAKAANNAVYAFFSETSDSLKNTNRESHLRNLREFIPLTDSVIHADLSKRHSLDQNYFDLSNDFQLGMASKREREEKEECQHTTHRFFEDWSLKNRDLWSDSRTQLSISIPMTSSD